MQGNIIEAICPESGTCEHFGLVHDHYGLMGWCMDCRRVWPIEELVTSPAYGDLQAQPERSLRFLDY